MSASAVGPDDEERPEHERDGERRLVEHASQERLGEDGLGGLRRHDAAQHRRDAALVHLFV